MTQNTSPIFQIYPKPRVLLKLWVDFLCDSIYNNRLSLVNNYFRLFGIERWMSLPYKELLYYVLLIYPITEYSTFHQSLDHPIILCLCLLCFVNISHNSYSTFHQFLDHPIILCLCLLCFVNISHNSYSTFHQSLDHPIILCLQGNPHGVLVALSEIF